MLAVPAGKSSELLVRLALDAGRPVSTDRLIDDLWGDDAVTTRRNTLQSKIAKLRRALGDPSVIVATDYGYTLAIEPDAVDVKRVIECGQTATALLNDGDFAATVECCAAALAMYRGPVLPGAGDGDWVTAHRARLEAAQLALVETSYEARVALGDVGVVGDIEAMLVDHPYQESLWALLITTLYRSGRQADALGAYQLVRARLGDDLGLDPGPGLQDLERQILTHHTALAPTIPALETATGSPVGNLPALAVDLVGRDGDISTIVAAVTGRRLVEIVGPGGIGKTATALAAGRALAHSPDIAHDGVWLARLETTGTADEVVDVLLAALDVTGGWAALRERLRHARALVIFDNCEHVIDAAAELAGRVLDIGPGVRILCTSQAPLGIDGETIHELAPLPLDRPSRCSTGGPRPQRRTVRPNDTHAVTELCRSLDGLPLAIELAAARTKTLSVEEINQRLDDRFGVLNDPTSRKPDRRRALKATIRWSYDLLFPDDQRGLWALATFAGGATLAAVDQFSSRSMSPPTPPSTSSAVLLSRSLRASSTTTRRHTTVRYRLLDSIRAFASGTMGDDGADPGELWRRTPAGTPTAAAAVDRRGPRRTTRLTSWRLLVKERANIDAALYMVRYPATSD